MSNASRCRKRAARYRALAAETKSPETARAYARLERLWLEMAPLAESVDRRSDWSARERLYEMIDAVEDVRHQVA
jgi:hypothetical protein